MIEKLWVRIVVDILIAVIPNVGVILFQRYLADGFQNIGLLRKRYDFLGQIRKDFFERRINQAKYGLEGFLGTDLTREELSDILISNEYTKYCKLLRIGKHHLEYDTGTHRYQMKRPGWQMAGAIAFFCVTAMPLLFLIAFSHDLFIILSEELFWSAFIIFVPMLTFLTIVSTVRMNRVSVAYHIHKKGFN